MTDREMLELAAKAAGIEGWWSGEDYCYGYNGNSNVPVPWRPLTDDGDALRLAVKLKLDIFFHQSRVETHIAGGRIPPIRHIDREEYGNDPYAATRCAIVRAAAEIGRNME